MIRQEILHFHVCGGAGGGKKGFNRGTARVGGATAVPRCIGGIDVDLAGIADFNRIPGAPATPLDLFLPAPSSPPGVILLPPPNPGGR